MLFRSEKCGNKINEGAKYCDGCGAQIGFNEDYPNHPRFVKRDMVIAIVLSFLTCGIYGIYWFITMTDDSNTLVDNKNASGATAFLYTLVTCGIYFIYWNYMMGKKMYEAGRKYGKSIDDNSVLYLLLSIFGLSLVNYYLIQNDLNMFYI